MKYFESEHIYPCYSLHEHYPKHFSDCITRRANLLKEKLCDSACKSNVVRIFHGALWNRQIIKEYQKSHATILVYRKASDGHYHAPIFSMDSPVAKRLLQVTRPKNQVAVIFFQCHEPKKGTSDHECSALLSTKLSDFRAYFSFAFMQELQEVYHQSYKNLFAFE